MSGQIFDQKFFVLFLCFFLAMMQWAEAGVAGGCWKELGQAGGRCSSSERSEGEGSRSRVGWGWQALERLEFLLVSSFQVI